MNEEWINGQYDELLTIVRELCAIPAPSRHEEKRAEYCEKKLKAFGFTDVRTDDANNVICEVNCRGSNRITVFAAHTDTVFPDTDPLPFREDEERMYCPGVGDDTASVAVLLMAAKYCAGCRFLPENGFLFVFNSGEEGLGNLYGTRRLFEEYVGRIARFVTFDSRIGVIDTDCVGSERYEVIVKTKGGHSYREFGKPNAIAKLAKIACAIYEIEPPAGTTYNIGNISGGTSVNTIAQSASMLCEYRSDDAKKLRKMKEKFSGIFRQTAETEGVEIEVKTIGVRPCAEIDRETQEKFAAECAGIVKAVCGDVKTKAASTDCNIPLSLGIPAVCVGVYDGDGEHTREEFTYKESLKTGLRIAERLMTELSHR